MTCSAVTDARLSKNGTPKSTATLLNTRPELINSCTIALCPADVNGVGAVNISDVLAVINALGRLRIHPDVVDAISAVNVAPCWL